MLFAVCYDLKSNSDIYITSIERKQNANRYKKNKKYRLLLRH